MKAGLVALLLLAAAGCAAPRSEPGSPAPAPAAPRTIVFEAARGLPLSGDLSLPPGPGPFLAVVLLHGCDGPASPAIKGWQPVLHSWGYAAFVVNSFGGRGLTTTCGNPAALWFTERVPDAYGALRALAREPKIARDRIALLGWADGAETALRAVSRAALERYGRSGTTGFRLAVALYPDCRVFFEGEPPRLRAYMSTLTTPVRLHVGELDDRAPPGPCRELAAALAGAGTDSTIVVYPGARHGFDSPLAPAPARAEATAGTARVRRAEDEWRAAATGAARKSVREQLRALLPPP